jgi:hypothetical protein
LALGYKHPDFLLSQLSSRQIAEWLAYNSIEPIGEMRGDLQAGIVASAVFNSKRTKEDQKVFSPYDFIPDYDKEPGSKAEPKKQSTEQMKAQLMALARVVNKNLQDPKAAKESAVRKQKDKELRKKKRSERENKGKESKAKKVKPKE